MLRHFHWNLLVLGTIYVASGFSSPINSEPPNQISCLLGVQWLVGLFPSVNNLPVQGESDCQLFYHCRAVGTNPLRAEPYQFNCSHADPSKPYYNANTCECVATKDHCSSNGESLRKCLRIYEAFDQQESCQGFGLSGAFYKDDFANLHNPSTYWSCQPQNLPLRPIVHKRPCVQGLVFNAQKCECDYATAENLLQFEKFNSHPMNRFLCAKKVDSSISNSKTKSQRGSLNKDTHD